MPDRILDQHFELPPNIVDLRYEEKLFEGSEDTEVAPDENGDIVVDYVESDPSAGSSILPPDNITIIEYIARIGEDGTVLVDVVIDVEGTPGASGYEVKVTKV
jgi:hypothetical protein